MLTYVYAHVYVCEHLATEAAFETALVQAVLQRGVSVDVSRAVCVSGKKLLDRRGTFTNW
jgi:hypothetical protein